MKSVEVNAKSVESAIEVGLAELNANELQVNIEVLEEPKRAMLGLFGGKDALVRLTLIEDADKRAKEFLEKIFIEMKIEADITAKINNETLNIELFGQNMAVLIGRRGQTLDSLQYLVSLIVNKGREDYLRVVLDTENYRHKRKETLEKLAFKLARKAKKMRKDIILEPMNPYERRIIHSALQNNKFVSTKSEGDEPYRKVVISLNR